MTARVKSFSARPASWAQRVHALIKSGNQTAAISQIRACAELADVKQLERMLFSQVGPGAVMQAVADQLQELSHPRLHRSP